MSDNRFDEYLQEGEHEPAKAAEAELLGTVLMQDGGWDVAGEVSQIVTTADFYLPAHGLVWDAAMAVYARGRVPNPVAVTAELTAGGDLHRVGGPGFLHALASKATVAAAVGTTAEAVRGYAVKRRWLEAAIRAVHGARNCDPLNPAEAMTAHLTELEALLGQGRERQEDYERFGDYLPDHLDALQDAPSEPDAVTGFADLDALMKLVGGQMVIVAGRPGMGKSAFALGAAVANAGAGNPTVIFSLEMDRPEIANRIIASRSRVAFDHLKRGGDRITDGDWTRIARQVPNLSELPLWMDYSVATPARVRARIKGLTKQYGKPPLCIVDHIGLMRADAGMPQKTLYERLTSISNELKRIARETGAVIVALSQLNRENLKRESKTPDLGDLRNSGALEEDADAVILMHRPDYYDEADPEAGSAQLIVAKHRNGAKATITVAAQFHYSRLVDMAREDEVGQRVDDAWSPGAYASDLNL
ncbi:replicative DNA helicase [Kitasatospora sp. NPDC015120]|uniref:replicative DNA helicase n=1 Tax=Kitasatospora sp. NPDC015120 TaxID=3364023 RepID=UPI0036F4846E